MSIYEEKTREYFDRTAGTYDSRLDARIAASCYDTVLEKLADPGCCSLLDVGCGTGAMLSRISGMGRNMMLCGVDISTEMTRGGEEQAG